MRLETRLSLILDEGSRVMSDAMLGRNASFRSDSRHRGICKREEIKKENGDKGKVKKEETRIKQHYHHQ